MSLIGEHEHENDANRHAVCGLGGMRIIHRPTCTVETLHLEPKVATAHGWNAVHPAEEGAQWHNQKH